MTIGDPTGRRAAPPICCDRRHACERCSVASRTRPPRPPAGAFLCPPIWRRPLRGCRPLRPVFLCRRGAARIVPCRRYFYAASMSNGAPVLAGTATLAETRFPLPVASMRLPYLGFFTLCAVEVLFRGPLRAVLDSRGACCPGSSNPAGSSTCSWSGPRRHAPLPASPSSWGERLPAHACVAIIDDAWATVNEAPMP